MKQRANLKIVTLELHEPCHSNIMAELTKSLQQQGWKVEVRQINSAEHFSDQIDTSFRLLVALSDGYFPEENYTWEQLTNPPKRPTGFGQSIKIEFNEPHHSLPQIGSLFQINPMPERSRDRATLEYVIKLNNDDLTSPEHGFQVFHQDYPAPIPSKEGAGLFGTLFGVSFANPKYSPNNTEPKNCIRSIAMSEYIMAFGYSANVTHYLTQQPSVTQILRRMTPANTISAIIRATHDKLYVSTRQRTEIAAQYADTELSVSALFNGIIKDELPDTLAWKLAYASDGGCRNIIHMIKSKNSTTTS
jgi:hypothetical protein